MQTSISKRFTKHTLLRSLFSTLLALSSLNHLALAQSPIQPLQNDPAIRQQLNRKNYEPSNTPNPNNLFPFKGHRGTVEHRTGSIRITNNQTTPLGGGVELQQLNYKGEIGFHTRFTNHGWKSHSPFDGRASKTGYGKGQSISDGYGPSSYAYTIQGTMVHPADGYEAPQGGGYPAPSKYGAHDRYNIKVSGQARRMVQKPLGRNFGWKQAWENTKHAGRTGIENAIHAGRKMDTPLVTYDRNQGFWTNSQTNIRNMLGRMNGKIEGALLIPSMGLHTAVGLGSAAVDSYQYNRDYQNYKKDIQQQKNMDERTLFWHLYGMGEQYTQKQLGKEPLKQVGQDIAEKANNFAQKYPTTTEAAELGFNLWGAGVVGKNSAAAVARSGADDFAGAVAARAAQQTAKKADDVVAAAQKAKPNVGVNDLPKKSTSVPRKSDVSKTQNINKTPDAPNYPAPAVSRAAPDVVANYQRRVDSLRNEFSHPNIRDNGNVAIADVDINGVNIDSIAAHSKIHEPNKGFAGDGTTKFDSMELPSIDNKGKLGKPYDRKVDAEYQIFSNTADRLGNNNQAKGIIKIYSEKEVCASCSNVAQQFKAKYPNVSIQIIDRSGKVLNY